MHMERNIRVCKPVVLCGNLTRRDKKRTQQRFITDLKWMFTDSNCYQWLKSCYIRIEKYRVYCEAGSWQWLFRVLKGFAVGGRWRWKAACILYNEIAFLRLRMCWYWKRTRLRLWLEIFSRTQWKSQGLHPVCGLLAQTYLWTMNCRWNQWTVFMTDLSYFHMLWQICIIDVKRSSLLKIVEVVLRQWCQWCVNGFLRLNIDGSTIPPMPDSKCDKHKKRRKKKANRLERRYINAISFNITEPSQK